MTPAFLAQSKRLFDVALPSDFSARLPAVHRALYLLFNEGYVRAKLCHEAPRPGRPKGLMRMSTDSKHPRLRQGAGDPQISSPSFLSDLGKSD